MTTELGQAFIDDHRLMMQSLNRLLEALEANDLSTAAKVAHELDHVAGPHIRFEEKYLYPIVKEARGRKYAKRLYEEHRIAWKTLQSLFQWEKDNRLDGQTQQELVENTNLALDHATSCGTLLSHLTTLPDDDQTRLLEKLRHLREEGICWTEIGHPSSEEET